MTLKRLGYVAMVVAVLFAVPITRRVVLYILPLGSGVDDIVFLCAAFLASVLWGGRIVYDLKKDANRLMQDESEWRKTKIIGGVIIAVAIVVVVVMTWMFLST